MAYRISYGQDKTYGSQIASKAKMWIAACILAAAAWALVQWQPAGKLLSQLLYPLGDESVSDAVQTMLDQVKNGTQVSDAVTSFCNEILALHGSVG